MNEKTIFGLSSTAVVLLNSILAIDRNSGGTNISYSELSGITGLSSTTISKCLMELEDRGLIQKVNMSEKENVKETNLIIPIISFKDFVNEVETRHQNFLKERQEKWQAYVEERYKNRN